MEEYERNRVKVECANELVGYFKSGGEEQAAEMVERYIDRWIGPTRPE